MKLKTLKDLPKQYSMNYPIKKSGYSVFIKDLKQEAIKWVKEDIEEHYNLFRDVLKGREIKSPAMTLIKKWMKRFNIIEEDLK